MSPRSVAAPRGDGSRGGRSLPGVRGDLLSGERITRVTVVDRGGEHDAVDDRPAVDQHRIQKRAAGVAGPDDGVDGVDLAGDLARLIDVRAAGVLDRADAGGDRPERPVLRISGDDRA